MKLKETELLQQLVRVPSVNPAFAAQGSAGEGPLTDFLQSLLDQLGWHWLRQQVNHGRDNLIALCPGQGADTTLWEVHQDTVGIAGMTIDPFAGEESQGRLEVRQHHEEHRLPRPAGSCPASASDQSGTVESARCRRQVSAQPSRA